MDRRTALKSTLVCGGIAAFHRHASYANPFKSVSFLLNGDKDRIPRKGEVFNEMFVFPDVATGYETHRITSHRPYNMKATYSMNTGFSQDEKHIGFCTWNDEGESALIRANVVTGDCEVLDYAAADSELKFTDGRNISMIPKTDLMTYSAGKQLLLYDIFTKERKIVHQLPSGDPGKLGYGVGTCDGAEIIFYRQFDTEKYGFQLYRLDLATGINEVIYEEGQTTAGHLSTNPVYKEYIIIQRSLGPYFGSTMGSCNDGVYLTHAREWIINIKTGKRIPIQPDYPCKFSWHANWSHDGKHAYYHGPSDGSAMSERIKPSPYTGDVKPHFIGVVDLQGTVVWENEYPRLSYGHVGSHTTKDAIIIDNLLAEKYVCAIHWNVLNAQGLPKIEILGKHNSTIPRKTQHSHPHSQMSRDGHWLIYNSMMESRANVYALKLQ